jgi:hypothetical protein
MAFANPAVKSCGALNVSSEATLAPGAYTRQSKGSDLWNEKLGITNGVTPISGPLSVVLTDLPSSTTTLSGTYPGLTTTYCFSATGNYVVPIDSLLPPGNDDTLLAGEGLSVPFVFAAQGGSSVKPTHYTDQRNAGQVARLAYSRSTRPTSNSALPSARGVAGFQSAASPGFSARRA